jgi:excisionase family DNA binding protein
MEKEYLSVKQAAVYLTLSRSTIYTYIHYKTIPFIKIGERVVREKSHLDRWVESQSKGGKK